MRAWLLLTLISLLTCKRPAAKPPWPVSAPVWVEPQYHALGDFNDPTVPLGLANTTFLLVLDTDCFSVRQTLTTYQPGAVLVQVVDKQFCNGATCYLVRVCSASPWISLPHRFLKPGTRWFLYIYPT